MGRGGGDTTSHSNKADKKGVAFACNLPALDVGNIHFVLEEADFVGLPRHMITRSPYHMTKTIPYHTIGQN